MTVTPSKHKTLESSCALPPFIPPGHKSLTLCDCVVAPPENHIWKPVHTNSRNPGYLYPINPTIFEAVATCKGPLLHDRQWLGVALPPAVAVDGVALPHRRAVCVPGPPQRTGHAVVDRLPAIAGPDGPQAAAAAVAGRCAPGLLRLLQTNSHCCNNSCALLLFQAQIRHVETPLSSKIANTSQYRDTRWW